MKKAYLLILKNSILIKNNVTKNNNYKKKIESLLKNK